MPIPIIKVRKLELRLSRFDGIEFVINFIFHSNYNCTIYARDWMGANEKSVFVFIRGKGIRWGGRNELVENNIIVQQGFNLMGIEKSF